MSTSWLYTMYLLDGHHIKNVHLMVVLVLDGHQVVLLGLLHDQVHLLHQNHHLILVISSIIM